MDERMNLKIARINEQDTVTKVNKQDRVTFLDYI
jgi:hypothetical protein